MKHILSYNQLDQGFYQNLRGLKGRIRWIDTDKYDEN